MASAQVVELAWKAGINLESPNEREWKEAHLQKVVAQSTNLWLYHGGLKPPKG